MRRPLTKCVSGICMAGSSCWAQLSGYNCGASAVLKPPPLDGLCLPSPHPTTCAERVSLRPGDPFRKIMGAEWHRVHWFATVAERDAALADMSRKHEYSR